jgi:hypothetical protein
MVTRSKLLFESIFSAGGNADHCEFGATVQIVAHKTQILHENSGHEGPPAAGLGNADAAHVSEYNAFRQAAGAGLYRTVALKPQQPFDAGLLEHKGT